MSDLDGAAVSTRLAAEGVGAVTLATLGDTYGDTPDSALTCKSDSGDSGDSHPGVTPPARRTSWTAAELMRVKFPAPRWAVPDLIPEGVTLLASVPKLGKSWFVLALAIAVASGGTALGSTRVVKGDVLYLALEDTGRRLQNRMGKLLGQQPAPDRLTLALICPPLPEGAAHITRWLDEHPDARLVVIDVFAKIKGADSSTSAYTADYAAVTRIKEIADRYNVAVILVHHVRKQGADDFLAEVSGTNGIAGACDSIAVLKRTRGSADAALHITGRDVDESEHALSFDKETGQWTRLAGPAVVHTVSETRATILAHLAAYPGHTPKQVADGTGLDHALVKQTLPRMAEKLQLMTDGKGHYRIPESDPLPDPDDIE